MIFLCTFLYITGAFNTFLMYRVGEECGREPDKGWKIVVLFWPVAPLMVIYNIVGHNLR